MKHFLALLVAFTAFTFAVPTIAAPVGNLPFTRGISSQQSVSAGSLVVNSPVFSNHGNLYVSAEQAGAGAHSVSLSWTEADSGATFNVFRAATTSCTSATTGFSQIATGVTTTSYSDTGLQAGGYCYQVVAVVNSVTSDPSNNAGVTIKPAAPSVTATQSN